jgi:small-conductance mechanosensitive channel
MVDVVVDSLRSEWLKLLEMTPRITAALMTLALSIIIGRILGAAAIRMFARSGLSKLHQSFFKRLLVWLVALLGFTVALNIVGLQQLATTLLAGGGVIAVVFGFAFRGIGENLLAGFFLAFSRPFQVGDLIEIGTHQGLVREVQLRYTHIRSADGRDIFVPSAQVFNEALVNFTKDGLRRLSFRVGVDYGEDPGKACEVVAAAVQGLEGVLPNPPVLVRIASLAPQYVELEAAFWIDTFAERSADADTEIVNVRTAAMAVARNALRANRMVMSPDVTTNLSLQVSGPVEFSRMGTS